MKQEVHEKGAPVEPFGVVLRLRPVLELSPDRLLELSSLDRDQRLELTAEGEFIVMPPPKPAAKMPAEAGILHEGDRVELTEGEIVAMASIGSRHTARVIELTRLLSRRRDAPQRPEPREAEQTP